MSVFLHIEPVLYCIQLYKHVDMFILQNLSGNAVPFSCSNPSNIAQECSARFTTGSPDKLFDCVLLCIFIVNVWDLLNGS